MHGDGVRRSRLGSQLARPARGHGADAGRDRDAGRIFRRPDQQERLAGLDRSRLGGELVDSCGRSEARLDSARWTERLVRLSPRDPGDQRQGDDDCSHQKMYFSANCRMRGS